MDAATILKELLQSPQVIGILITAAGLFIHNGFTKLTPPSTATKAYLQIGYVVLSGLAQLLDMYMNGQLGSISAAAIQNFLNIYISAIATHFGGGALVKHQVKPLVEKIKASK